MSIRFVNVWYILAIAPYIDTPASTMCGLPMQSMPFKSAMAILANSSLAEAYGVESCPKEPLAAFEKAKNFSRCPCDLNVFKGRSYYTVIALVPFTDKT